MTDKTIYLVRHGETDYNLRGIVQGSGVDADLNETGRQQARAFFSAYETIDFDVVITSALRRTHQTVAPFVERGHRWEQDADINELNWGTHEGRASTPEMRAEYLAVTQAWSTGDYERRMTGGESAQELAERLARFVAQLRQRPEKTILVCSHGRAMCGLICVLKGEPLSNMYQYKHHNTGLWQVQQRGSHFAVLVENDIRHLSAESILVVGQK